MAKLESTRTAKKELRSSYKNDFILNACSPKFRLHFINNKEVGETSDMPKRCVKIRKILFMNEKIRSSFKYIVFWFYIIGVPIFLYVFATWNASLGRDELGAWPIVIVYWILIHLVHKYKDNQDRYKYALERILKLDRPLSGEEKTEVYTEVLQISKWDVDENGNLKKNPKGKDE